MCGKLVRDFENDVVDICIDAIPCHSNTVVTILDNLLKLVILVSAIQRFIEFLCPLANIVRKYLEVLERNALCHVQAVVEMGDRDEDGLLDFREFINYCAEHEKKLWLVFQNLDTNQDGESRSLVTVNVIFARLDGQLN